MKEMLQKIKFKVLDFISDLQDALTKKYGCFYDVKYTCICDKVYNYQYTRHLYAPALSFRAACKKARAYGFQDPIVVSVNIDYCKKIRNRNLENV